MKSAYCPDDRDLDNLGSYHDQRYLSETHTYVSRLYIQL